MIRRLTLALLLAGVVGAESRAAERVRFRLRARRAVCSTQIRETVSVRASGKLSAQQICELKSEFAAKHGIFGHVLSHLGFGRGGVFEGCGVGQGKGKVGTCVPRSGKLIGDSTTTGRHGLRYRVRIWSSEK